MQYNDNNDLPLVVDLDGTLLRSDSLDETFVNLFRNSPGSLLRLPMQLIRGRAAFKAFVAAQCPPNVTCWPINEEVVAFLENRSTEGVKIVLATAADQSIGAAIAKRFPFIDQVIASSNGQNMKGATKADELARLFPSGFLYAGNSSVDYPVWERSKGAIVVNASERIRRRAEQCAPIIEVFPPPKKLILPALKEMRLHQWVKNVLIFTPLILGGQIFNLAAWLVALQGFIALGLVASANYIINDMLDLSEDRKHWSKSSRPIASGDLSLRSGALLALLSLTVGFTVAAYIGLSIFGLLLAYLATTLVYSFSLKRIPILDVVFLAGLFSSRLLLGGILTGVQISSWLMIFSMFVFTSLSLSKRHVEILRSLENKRSSLDGRGYILDDAPMTLGLGLSAMVGAVLVMAIYLIEDAIKLEIYANPGILWIIPVALFLFLGRIWLLAQRGIMRDDPLVFALEDRPSLLLGFTMLVVLILALFDATSFL